MHRQETAIETGLRRLRYFRTLAETLSFRRAAARLNITQPALSRAIAQLEADVGAALFDRSHRRVALTPAGEAFSRGCDRVLASLEATIEETNRIARGDSGTLLIGYTDTVIAGCLPDIVDGFRQVAPGVTVKLVQAYSELQLEMLHEGRLDVALMTGPVPDRDLEGIVVQRDRFMVLLHASHRLAQAPSLSLSDLSEEPFVLGDLDRWGVFNAHLFERCARAGFRPRIVQTAPESRAIIGLVTCGVGVTVMPECLVAASDHRTVARRIDGLALRMETLACWRPTHVQPVLRHFVRFLEARPKLRRSEGG